MHRPLRRTLPALAIAGIALATPLAFATSAQAKPSNQCSSVGVEYSTDGGQTWSQAGRVGQPYTKFVVRLTETPADGCEYKVSLASYSTQGPSWSTSGTQTFLGWDTTTLDKKQPKATLDVSSHTPPCFGQIDLYGTGVKHDGITGPLPKYPDAVFPKDLITAWNGGTACTTPTPPITPPTHPTPPVTPPSPPVAPPSGSTSTPPAGPTKTPSASPSPSSSTSASAKPSGSPSAPASSAAATVPSGSPSTPATTAQPVGTPAIAPASTTPTGLAFTGTNGSALVGVSIGAAGLLVVGAGAVVLTRRRAAHR
ncbi:hypothetical protein P3T37_002625 [Kitasatospora sp. MAA4]|uniref:hypothetical protein n=1 Tax=Kitasatospora sp. MAA4 TaxID=3035093 RepID=UPI002473EA1A|nr:hypothetical protein [Kitasatospora sp. MAA4]MDH6133230.1 hypothetical protein [Kitasatospora sp. MAA4]